MHNAKFSKSLCRVVLFLLASGLSAFAQSTTATLEGTIYDPTNAVMPNVKVTAVQPATGQQRSAVTNEEGAFILRSLPIGEYAVTAEMAGFKKEEMTNIVLQIDQTVRIDFNLKPGQVGETITVQASAPLLSVSSDVGSVVDNQRIIELPMNRREFLQLAELEPGVVPPPPGTFLERNQGQFTTISAGGQRQEYQSVTINGINNMDPQNNNLAVRPSVDAIQEFKIQTSNYSADSYSKGSININLAIRSGTNKFHAGIYEFLRNDHLDAKNFFDVTPSTPPYHQNQFGGTIGGPIRRDRTFFFGAYEGARVRRSQTAITNAPTLQQQQGIFDPATFGVIYDPLTLDPQTGIREAFPGNTIPAGRIHPISKKIEAYLPLPNNLRDPRRNLVSNPLEEDTINQYNSRVDHLFNASNTMFASYNLTDRYHVVPAVGSVGGGAAAGGQSQVGGARFNDRSQHFSLGYTHIFSPRLLNELSLGFVRFQHNEIGRNQGKSFEPEFGIPGTETKPALVTWPTFNVSGYAFPSEGRSIRYWNGTFQLQNSVIIQRGNHSIRVGGMAMQLLTFDSNCTCVGTYGINGGYTSRLRGQVNGDAFAQFLLGDLSSLSRGVETDRAYIYGFQYSAFVQDDWRVSSRLTLNIGMRYDYSTPFREKQNRISSWDPVTGEAIYPESAKLVVYNAQTGANVPYNPPFAIRRTSNNGLIESDKLNFAPRVGFAYQLRANLVMRGGYGIFNIMTASRPFILEANTNPPFAFTLAQIVDPDVPNFTWDKGFTGAGTNTAINFWRAGDIKGRKNGYNQNWNYGFQWAVRPDIMIETSYVGAGGRHLDQNRTLNVPQPGPGVVKTRRPFPNIGQIRDFYQGARSSYQSLQMKLVKRFTNGLAVNVAYTRSKSIDTQSTDTGTQGDISGTENPFKLLGSMRGVSAFDLPPRLVVNYVWEIPFGPRKRFLNSGPVALVLGGWQLTGILSTQSGYPYTVTANSVTNNGTGGRPDRLCNGTLSNPSLDRWFDTSCFAAPAIYTYGTSGRNILRADPYTNFDSGLYRNFKVPHLGESGRLQFRAEFYNLLNHPNFGLPVNSINSTTRGVVTAALPARLIQFGLKLNF